jgi:hypothetical protein
LLKFLAIRSLTFTNCKDVKGKNFGNICTSWQSYTRILSWQWCFNLEFLLFCVGLGTERLWVGHKKLHPSEFCSDRRWRSATGPDTSYILRGIIIPALFWTIQSTENGPFSSIGQVKATLHWSGLW